MPAVLVVDTPEQLAHIFAARTAEVVEEAKAARRRASLTLPGGSVAKAFFPILAGARIDWTAIDWFWGDERAVPPDREDSNFRLAADRLFSRVAVDPSRIHRMRGEAEDLDRAAAEYEAEILSVVGPMARLDLVLLGVGPDGHVCSLFPGHPALEDWRRRVVAITDAPKPPPKRLTLTLAALADAEITFAAFGAEKAPVIRDALENPASALPVARAAKIARRAVFLLDADAAP